MRNDKIILWIIEFFIDFTLFDLHEPSTQQMIQKDHYVTKSIGSAVVKAAAKRFRACWSNRNIL